MQQRRGTAAQWSNADPILAAGEIGFESDTSKFKIGDGVNHWDDLVYYSSAADLAAIIDGAPDLLNTLGELAAALGDDPDIITTLQSDVGTKQDIVFGVSSTEIGYLNGVTSGIQGQIESKADASALEAKQDRVTDVSDTEIGYLNGVTSSIQSQLDDKVAAIDLSNHASDTTSIHGITDTALLVTTTGAQTLSGKTLANPTLTLGYEDQGLPVSFTVGTEELSYLDGVTSNIQTQLNAKATTSALTKSSVGLANVDNTSDASKPVSTATQTALDLKANLAGPTFTGTTTAAALTVTGDLTVSGTTTTINTANLNVTDAMIYMGDGNSANLVDLGIVSAFNDGTYQHSGLVRDSSAGTWKLFKGVTDEPTTTVNFAQGSLDALAVGTLEATTVTPSSGVVFSDGTQTKEGVPSRTPIVAKTASYTLSALTERDSLVEVSSSSATTVTIPTDATLNFPIGTSLDILQTSTGQVTIAGAGGVTVNATPGLKLRTQWSSATLFKRASDTWVVYGDLTA